MNYRNFDNKNPLGEARMFNQKAVVAVIQRHFADDMKTLEEADDEFRDEDGVVLPNKSPDEWVATLARSQRLKESKTKIPPPVATTQTTVKHHRKYTSMFTIKRAKPARVFLLPIHLASK
ncbi:unnamed protein product [Aphanomyces euteiches]